MFATAGRKSFRMRSRRGLIDGIRKYLTIQPEQCRQMMCTTVSDCLDGDANSDLPRVPRSIEVRNYPENHVSHSLICDCVTERRIVSAKVHPQVVLVERQGGQA